ncbi:MAG TPA: YbaN family protein [Bacillota bacterium]|nr:YbaN family protein [Bacillota bacterium]
MHPPAKLNILLIIIGCLAVVVGTIGIFLPILPTTPFLLLAAACLSKGSKRLYNKLMGNRVLGSYIRNYQEGKGLPLPSKIFTIGLLWLSIGSSALFFIGSLALRLLLLLIAIGVTIHLVRIKTVPR